MTGAHDMRDNHFQSTRMVPSVIPEGSSRKNQTEMRYFCAGSWLYLQNAHRVEQLFREYMFIIIWRTRPDRDRYGLARPVLARPRIGATGFIASGRQDLTDQVDGGEKRWGGCRKNTNNWIRTRRIYGGSYGGFITVNGMFTTPELVFAAGAAPCDRDGLAHYQSSLNANSLNETCADSIDM